MKKKVTASRKRATSSRASKNDNNTFLIIVGGGFVVVSLVLFFSGLLPFSVNILDISQNQEATQTLGASTTQSVINVSFEDNAFGPQKVLVGQGATVVWTNNSGVPMSVMANDGSFDTGVLQPGESKSVIFAKGGIYPYHSSGDDSAAGVVAVLQ